MDLAYLWLQSGLPASLHGLRLKPRAHPKFKHLVLREEKGQGSAYYLVEEGSKNRQWILKRFRPAMAPNSKYLQSIRQLVPTGQPFIAATKRVILHVGDVQAGPGLFYANQFAQWLAGTILMPRVPGYDWGLLADDIRSGRLEISEQERLKLALGLAQAVEQLEKAGCSHRDLSLGNVFYDLPHLQVYLIDFDTLFHRELTCPDNTTPGTTGYMAPWIYQDGWNPQVSWCPQADRFALGILVSEMLLLKPGAPAFYDGALFSQEMLARPYEEHVQKSCKQLQARFPLVAQLFEQILLADNFTACPTPRDWIRALQGQEPLAQRRGCRARSWVGLLLLLLLIAGGLGLLKWWEHLVQTVPASSSPVVTPSPRVYHLRIEYTDTDLQLWINQRPVVLRADNTVRLRLRPGRYQVALRFTGVYFGEDGSIRRTSPRTITRTLSFAQQTHIVWHIDRKSMQWQIK